MTQEELDALMSGDIDDIDALEEEPQTPLEETQNEELSDSPDTQKTPEQYTEDTSHHWPLPATDENKMVHQLDNVTKESEEKASQIFDIIEHINNDLMEKESTIEKIAATLSENIELFKTLNTKFPDVEAFKTSLATNESALNDADDVKAMLQTSSDSIMSVMDIMQYQDIHRQKIERVINVMRALSKYMNTLFEGKIEDDKRASSAKHIQGDTHKELASTDDIEALLEQFAQAK
ncbi:chemotaxis protein [bacterium]|nr:chemotaxis protein [bacterium]MBU1989706.1 chemotaxis protein [bacterium]